MIIDKDNKVIDPFLVRIGTDLRHLTKGQDNERELLMKYVKEGKQFWTYVGNDVWEGIPLGHHKITITYVRSGAVFFTFEGYEDKEFYASLQSIFILSLHPTVLCLKEYGINLDNSGIIKYEFDDYGGRMVIV
jgi:hypothetical protein